MQRLFNYQCAFEKYGQVFATLDETSIHFAYSHDYTNASTPTFMSKTWPCGYLDCDAKFPDKDQRDDHDHMHKSPDEPVAPKLKCKNCTEASIPRLVVRNI